MFVISVTSPQRPQYFNERPLSHLFFQRTYQKTADKKTVPNRNNSGCYFWYNFTEEKNKKGGTLRVWQILALKRSFLGLNDRSDRGHSVKKIGFPSSGHLNF